MTDLHGTSTGLTPGRIQKWIRLVFALATLATLPLCAATFTVTLDHDTISLGDMATLSLRFDGDEPSSSLELPEISGLQFPNANRPTINRININGQRTLILSVLVKPTQTGDYTIPSLTAKVGNEILTSEPAEFKVVRAATPEPGSEAEQQALALLRVALPKKEVYLGETFVLEMQLLIRAGVQELRGIDLPGVGGPRPLQLEGCTVGKAAEGQRRQTVVGNTSFTIIPLLIPVTVMKTGTLTLGPLDGAAVVEMPGRGGQPSLFDGLPGGLGLFNRGPQQRVAVSAPAQTITALPLPDTGKPATFSGAVGKFQMAVSAGPTNVAVGDPITIRVEINGRGALDSFTLPDQPAWKEFKTYPPTVKSETTGNLGLDGTKSFEQVVVPQNTEIKELPPFEFAYFDPEQRAYQTLRQAALPIIVRPSGSTPSPTLALGNKPADAMPPAQDIVHIKPRLGRVDRNEKPWIRQTWFLTLQGLPVLALIGAIVWRQRRDTLANNPRLRRQRQVEQQVREGMAQLQQFAADRNSDEFFAMVFRLLQEQIGERLALPASAITEAVVEELRTRGLTESAADSVHELFQRCNQARYAPVESAQQLEAIIPRLESALCGLREVKA